MIKNLKSDSKFPDFQIKNLFVAKDKITPQIFAKIKAKITELTLRKTTKKIKYENNVFKNPTKIYLNLIVIYDK